MKKKFVLFMLIATMSTTALSGCGNKKVETPNHIENVEIDESLETLLNYIKDLDKLAVIENAANVDLEAVINEMGKDNDMIETITVDDSKVDYAKAGKYPVNVSIKERIPEGHTHDENSDHTEEDHVVNGTVDVEIIEKDKVDEALNNGNIIIGDDNKIIENEKLDSEADKDDAKEENKETDNNLVAKDDKKPSKSENKPNKPSEKPNKPSEKPNKPDNKPSKPDSKPSKPDSKPSKPDSNPSKPDNKPSKPDSKPNNKPSDKHEHSWKAIYETVHHKEEGHYEKQMVEEAWTEEIWEVHDICNYCGADITALGVRPSEHGLQHALAGEGAGGHHTKQVLVKTIPHDPIYEEVWVVDKPSWTEQKKTHEECSCGARR